MSPLRAALRRLRGLVRSPRGAERKAFLVDRLPKHATCAEIGVWRGEFSRKILERSEPARLHLIDPWAFRPEYPSRWYGGGIAKSQRDMDDIYAEVARTLGGAPNVEIHRTSSREAAARFTDETFDWVYIDADHSYQSVREDLELYWPKVKPGGLITGDDYRKGVRRAVDELVESGRVRFLWARKSQFVLQKTATRAR